MTPRANFSPLPLRRLQPLSILILSTVLRLVPVNPCQYARPYALQLARNHSLKFAAVIRITVFALATGRAVGVQCTTCTPHQPLGVLDEFEGRREASDLSRAYSVAVKKKNTRVKRSCVHA